MLSEVEEYFRVCHDFPAQSDDSSEPSGRCSMEGLLQQWNARLQMAQVGPVACHHLDFFFFNRRIMALVAMAGHEIECEFLVCIDPGSILMS